MNRMQLRNIHRWVFTIIGIFMITWLLSGMLMAMPHEWFDSTVWHKSPPSDYRQAVLSPAEVIARLETDSTAPVETKSIKLRQINEHLLYAVKLADGSEQLIDAASGERFHFTEELAESIVRSSMDIDAPVAEIERLTEHSTVYPWGSLPVYRVVFADRASASYFLAQSDLKVFLSTPVTRVRSAIISLHEFGPIKLLGGEWWIRKGLLISISGIALLGAIAGMLLTLPRRNS
jgi:hypothetical protein